MKKCLLSIVAVSIFFTLSVTAFATNYMTFDEAKSYLENYCEVKTNTVGNAYTVQYTFPTEADLNKAAAYIEEHGLDEFNSALDVAIATEVASEAQTTMIMPRTTSPTVAYETVSGNGEHYVFAESYGVADFGQYGEVHYIVALGYTAVVSGGKFTAVEEITFDIPIIDNGGRYGQMSYPYNCYDYECGVTANYVIKKDVYAIIDDFSFVVDTVTDNEIFALLTSLE